MKIYTIGFTKKSAEKFFDILTRAGVKRIVDIRLNNTSQLAGFAKHEDIRFFLKKICNIEYVNYPELAPTKEILDDYKKYKEDWNTYEKNFMGLLLIRDNVINENVNIVEGDCLLCSEATPEYCHRRLVAEYFKKKNPNVEIEHL